MRNSMLALATLYWNKFTVWSRGDAKLGRFVWQIQYGSSLELFEELCQNQELLRAPETTIELGKGDEVIITFLPDWKYVIYAGQRDSAEAVVEMFFTKDLLIESEYRHLFMNFRLPSISGKLHEMCFGMSIEVVDSPRLRELLKAETEAEDSEIEETADE